MSVRGPGRTGFTLIETLIAVTVTGLVLAIAIPPATDVIHRSQVRRAAQVVVEDLRLSFALAAGQRRPVRISYDAGATGYEIVRVADGTRLRSRRFGAGSAYRLSTVMFSTPTIDVYPSGLATSGLTVTLTSGGEVRYVTMMRAGLVRVVQP